MNLTVNREGGGICAGSTCATFAFVYLMLAAFPVSADVRPAALFTDGMVLQQGIEVPVWGWADDGEQVTVQFGAQSAATVTRNGKWRVRLQPLQATAIPGTLIVTGHNRIEISDVAVGEVWVAAGQSNMQWPMSRTEHADADIARAYSPALRIFTVAGVRADMPAASVRGQWSHSSPDSVKDFSAVAWYFGRALQSSLRVPVGLILAAWGGSPIRSWMNDAAAPDVMRAAGLDSKPFELYNGMIAPLMPYAIRGVIWYQGESNEARAWQYRTLLPGLITGWRREWGEGDFAFLLVQLPPWDRNRGRSLAQIAADPAGGEGSWAVLREAQLLSTKLLPKVGMAVTTDAGDKDNLHPPRKRPVGERLALAARGIAYGEAIEFSGPVYRDVRFSDGKASISFTHTGTGLAAGSPGRSLELSTGDGQGLDGFTIAGEDRKFVRARAIIRGERVEAGSPAVPAPTAVRYGWADYPLVNLYNSAGLPASPFRTDDWPVSTQPD